MDFIKNQIEQKGEQAVLQNAASQFLGNSGSGNQDNGNTKTNVETSTDSQGNTQVNASKYSSYVNQGVQYAEKNVLHMDTNNMSDGQKKVESTVETFITKQVDNYAGGNSNNNNNNN